MFYATSLQYVDRLRFTVYVYQATASGDQSAAVSDVERQVLLYHLKTHSGSVKQIIFDPHNPSESYARLSLMFNHL